MAKKCTLTEQEIVEGLRDEARRDQVHHKLYLDDEVRTSVFGYVINRGGDIAQATRVFDYAFEVFDRQVREGKYQGNNTNGNSWRKYLSSIAYNAWKKKLHDRIGSKQTFEELKDYDVGIDPITETDIEFWERAKPMLDRCGELCYTIFRLTAEEYSGEEIAKQLGLSHDAMRQRKRICKANFIRLFGTDNPF